MTPKRLGDLAEIVGGRVIGDPERTVTRVRARERAEPCDLSFLTHARYRDQARRSLAGALLVGADGPGLGLAADLIVCANPERALAQVLDHLHPRPAPPPGIHPTAVVGTACVIAPSASVGPYTVIGDDCRIGAASVVESFVHLGRGCRIGERVLLHPHVVLYDQVELGDGTEIHSGAVIGADGFGYAGGESGAVKVPQVGRVVIEEDVEVGANSAIDRATLEATRIGRGTKIDNLVQVGHNSELGEDCCIVAQVGISGSVEIGARSVLSGQVGVADHAVLDPETRVGAQSGVIGHLTGGEWIGYPALRAPHARRVYGLLARLPELFRELRQLRGECAELRARLDESETERVAADAPESGHER